MCIRDRYYALHAVNVVVAVISGVDFIVYNFAVFHNKDISPSMIVWS